MTFPQFPPFFLTTKQVLQTLSSSICNKGRSPFNGRQFDFSSCILVAKYLFTGSLKKPRPIDI